MFKEYDIVIADKKLSEQIVEGCMGAILLCFDNDSYEVEFVDGCGEIIEVLTVTGIDLRIK